VKVFVAVDLPDEPRAALAATLADLDLPGKVAPPENWHITLRYIGAMDDVAIDRLLAGLHETELGGPFTLRTAGLGAFPRPERATVLWVGVLHGSDRLEALSDLVQDVVEDVGLDREDRPFVGHLTLARIRPPEDVRRLTADVELPSISVPVESITVFESIQRASGPEYAPIERFEL
jgi:2'-5' RNA ligase